MILSARVGGKQILVRLRVSNLSNKSLNLPEVPSIIIRRLKESPSNRRRFSSTASDGDPKLLAKRKKRWRKEKDVAARFKFESGEGGPGHMAGLGAGRPRRRTWCQAAGRWRGGGVRRPIAVFSAKSVDGVARR